MLIPYLLVGAALFTLGLIGFVTRRNLIIIFLCTELMFQGVVVNLVAFGRYPLHAGLSPTVDGQIFGLFLLVVAASEAAVALALVVLLYRCRGSLDADTWKLLKEE